MHPAVSFTIPVLLLATAAHANLVVNGDFQTGAIGPSTSAYTVSGTMLPPAVYNIVSLDTLHPNWADFYDHTFGDDRGFFMVVNGTNSGLGPAWAQVVTVAPNTEYTLSAWFASVFPQAPANLEFRINGQVVQPAFMLGNATGVWEQHGVTFTTGAATSISVEIWDTNQVFSGNDYAIDDISLTVVPTPGAAGLAGLGALALLRRRR